MYKNCTVPNCNRKYLAKGYCRLHYDKFRKYGDPLKTMIDNNRDESGKFVKNHELGVRFKKGIIPWNKGKIGVYSGEQIEKFRKAHINKKLGESRRGVNNWNWKGGVSLIRSQGRYGIKWNRLRDYVYKRDNYICQDCGIKCSGKRNKSNRSDWIQCHHIVPWILTKDNNMNNLETLCLKCHTIKDRQFQYVL